MSSAATADDTIRLAIAQIRAWESQPAVLGRDAFKKRGIALAITESQGAAEALQAVMDGNVDVAVGIDAAMSLRAFASGAPVRVLMPIFTGTSNLYWYVKADSPLKSAGDTNDANSIAYSTRGSLTNWIAADLARELKLRGKPVMTGSPSATLIEVVSGKVDIGWVSAPFGLKEVAEGKIRIIARGSDIAPFKSRTMRVALVNAEALQKKKDALLRFVSAWREAGDSLYASAEARKSYAQAVHIAPEIVEEGIRNFFPKAALQNETLSPLDDIVADAMKRKIVEAAPAKDRLSDFIAIPPRQ